MVKIAGIDISTWQTNVDYNKIAKGKIGGSPIKFVMVRATYGTSEDNMFKKHVDGCLKAGLNVGLYCFSTATTVAGAKKEAEAVINLIKKYGYDGKLTYPIAYDLELETTAKLGSTLCTNLCKAFCETIESYNYMPLIYTNLNWLFWAKNINYNELSKYKFWIAGYVRESTMSPYKNKAAIWQYSVAGNNNYDVAGVKSVPGVPGECDCNWGYVQLGKEIREKGMNKFKTNNTTNDVKIDTPKFKVGDKVTLREGALVYFGNYSSNLYLLNLTGPNPYGITYEIKNVKPERIAKKFATDNKTSTPYADNKFHPYHINIKFGSNTLSVNVNQSDLTKK